MKGIRLILYRALGVLLLVMGLIVLIGWIMYYDQLQGDLSYALAIGIGLGWGWFFTFEKPL